MAKPLLLVSVLTLVLYARAFEVFFGFDDILFLGSAAGLVPWDPGVDRLLSTRAWFETTWALFGPNPIGYHALALVLHAVNAVLVHRIALALGSSPLAGLYAACLFVASPAAFTPLHWISGTQELLYALFALLAGLAALAPTERRAWLALPAGAAALLCKLSALVVLPTLALVLPVPRRRRIVLGAGGVLLAILIVGIDELARPAGSPEPILPAGGGLFASRPEGHPYETAFGANLVYTLLGFSAWTVRLWDAYPDHAAELKPALWPWGLVLPLALAAAAVLRPGWRGPILRAASASVLLLAPALPLVRHSRLNYLYLPLVPLFLLAGAGLAALHIRRRALAIAIATVLVLVTGWRGAARFGMRNAEGPADTHLMLAERYGSIAASLAASPEGLEGDLLVLTPQGARPGAVREPPRGGPLDTRLVFSPLEKVTFGGLGIRLLHSGITSVTFVNELWPRLDWEEHSLWVATGAATLRYLGRGLDARAALCDYFLEQGLALRARHEATALVNRRPGNPDDWYRHARAERALGNADGLARDRAALRRLARSGDRSEVAERARELLVALDAGGQGSG
jgi:hypothetical protein